MRHLLLTVLALGAASPALAQTDPAPPPYGDEDPAIGQSDDRGPPPRYDDRRSDTLDSAANRLGDPRTARAVADAMTAMSDALLDIRIDRVRAAMDPRARYDRNGARTLGDLVERNDPNFRERLHRDAERSVRTTGAVARSAAEMAPELRAIADEFGHRIEDAIARAEPR